MTPVFLREVAWPCATCMARSVLIGTAIASALSLVVAPRVFRTFGESKSKADIALATVKKYAFEAFPAWADAHPDRPCPRSLAELDAHLDAIDPWGTRYHFACGAHAVPKTARDIWVISAGEDGVFGTADDLRSDR